MNYKVLQLAVVLVQVMKMVMTLLAPADGLVHFQQLEGSLLSAGDLIARLQLDNPAAAQQVTPYNGGFPELGPPLVHSSKVDQRFKAAFASAKNVLQGAHQMQEVSKTSPAGSSQHPSWCAAVGDINVIGTCIALARSGAVCHGGQH